MYLARLTGYTSENKRCLHQNLNIPTKHSREKLKGFLFLTQWMSVFHAPQGHRSGFLAWLGHSSIYSSCSWILDTVKQARDNSISILWWHSSAPLAHYGNQHLSLQRQRKSNEQFLMQVQPRTALRDIEGLDRLVKFLHRPHEQITRLGVLIHTVFMNSLGIQQPVQSKYDNVLVMVSSTSQCSSQLQKHNFALLMCLI